MEQIQVKVKLVREGACVPSYATSGSAACDLSNAGGEITVAPGERVLIPTGIALDPGRDDVVAIVAARSGLSRKHGIALANGIGVIDSDYRGEVLVSVVNLSDEPYTVAPGERIAQLMFMPVIKADFAVTDELSDTARGSGGFGSTGA